MTKLLHANFYRLRKSKCFWILLVIMFLLGIYFYINYNGFHPERCVNCSNPLGSVLFCFLGSTWITLPIFTSFFMKPLYGNGIIKNMVIIGHKRKDIYLANLITIVIVNLLFSLIFVLGTILTGVLLVPDIDISLNKLLFLIFDAVLLSISYASLFNFIGMSFGGASTSMAFIVTVWGMIISSSVMGKYMAGVNVRLNNFYEFVLSAIPIGQGLLILDLTDSYKFLWIYSLVFIMVINYLGLFIINRKELN